MLRAASRKVEMMYPRLPPETARRLAHGPRPMAMPPDDFMAPELLGVEPIELPGGHFPMVEDPDGLAALPGCFSPGR